MKLRQHVRYIKASDGARLAWAESGVGPIVVKAANWLTHLEYEWESPVWKHWIQFFSAHCRFVRYDERGCGMSDWQGGPLSLDQWAADLQSIIDAARPAGPVTLLGISQGAATCIHYAIRHPERVARLILYGGYARGALRRGTPGTESAHRAMIDLARAAWGRDNPTFRQVFVALHSGGSHEQLDWFNDLCRKTTSGEIVASLFEARAVVDIAESLGEVRAPTLVLHARDDEVIPIAEGRLLASGIPGAEFVELDSRNHILLEGAWPRFGEAVLSFLRQEKSATDSAFAALSARERQVLALMADGLSNMDIAERLQISEKTVRNHASNLFDKLGVWSRAQAIVFAHDNARTSCPREETDARLNVPTGCGATEAPEEASFRAPPLSAAPLPAGDIIAASLGNRSEQAPSRFSDNLERRSCTR
jgi:pimeloyl-ACP methyl ester carboxylesterase/DNA-binding CsgD family transcriptional regulator